MKLERQWQEEQMRVQSKRLAEPESAARALARSWVAGALGIIVSGVPLQLAFAASHYASGDSSKRSSNHFKESQGTGLDKVTLALANRGEWQAVATRLEERAPAAGSRQSAWLAFTYMYLGRCDDLHALSQKAAGIFDARNAAHLPAVVPKTGAGAGSAAGTTAGTAAAATETLKAANEAETFALIVQSYDEICATRYSDAAVELTLLPDWFRYDALANFTLAALSAKQGRSADAVDYLKRSVGAAPDFAWGFRTLGKLEVNRLNDPQKAQEFFESALAIEPDLSEVVDTVVDMRLKKNNFDAAIDAAKAAIVANPKQSGGYYRLAQIYIQQWRLREALIELESAIALDPETARYYRSRATIKRWQGDINDAIADEQKAVDLSKDKTFELIELAEMNVTAGNINRAANNLEEALKHDQNNQVAHDKLIALLNQEKRYDDLIAEYRRFLALKPKDSQSLLGIARALLADGTTDAAIAQFKEAANLDPNNPDPHRELGALRLKQKDYAAAAREYTHALNINPSSVPDLVALGYAYAQNDDYAQAEAALVTAIALQQLTQPNMQRASAGRLDLMRALAVLLIDEGRYSEAASQFEGICAGSKGTDLECSDQLRLFQAKCLRDLSLTAAKGLLEVYQKLTPKQQAEERPFLITTLLESNKPALALQLIDEENKLRPDVADTRLKIARARALMLEGKIADARAMVAGVVPTESGRSSAEVSNQYVTLSQIAMAADDLPSAAEFAGKAIEKYNKNFNAFIQRGRVAVREKKFIDATELAKRALEINQYATDAYLVLGQAQEGSGKVKDASASYRRAVELYPGLLSAHRALLETLRKLALPDEAKREESLVAQMEKQQ